MDNLSPPPPPLNSTPPIIVNTPPAKSCAGWKTFSVILLVLLIGSVALNFLGLLSSMFGGGSATGAQSGKHFFEVVVDNPTAKDKIAVVEVKGMISSEPWSRGGKSLADIVEDQLKWAGEDEGVKAVVLKVDSPGGEVMASDDIANAIRKFQDKHKKPVVASMGSLAASGGY
jgi:protease IV